MANTPLSDINAALAQVTLDNRNEAELTLEAKRQAQQTSNNTLTSVALNDPLDVLVRTQAYVHARLLYEANKMPLALLSEFLRRTGVTPTTGTKAVFPQTFTLTTTRPNFIIPSGYKVSTQSGLNFYTVADLVLNNVLSGTVDVVAEEAGTQYNVSPNTITRLSVPLAFLRSTTNANNATTPGRDFESSEDTVQRQLQQLSRRSPVSARDYELFAQDVLGSGSVVKAIGLLGADKVSEELGAVHVFCLSSTGQPAGQGELALVRTQLQDVVQLGTRLWVSPMDVLPINANVVAKLSQGVDVLATANGIWQVFNTYINDTLPGETVTEDELKARIRFVGVETTTTPNNNPVSYVELAQLNNNNTVVPMPNDFTKAIPQSLTLQLVDSNGTVYDLAYGAGDVD